jgi:carboxypeptidase C (cathepsin A)
VLDLDTLGIENGCIDLVSQMRSFPDFVFNNTYGLQLINQTVHDAIIQNITDPNGGCLALATQCRELASVGDPQFNANNDTVNQACSLAGQACLPYTQLSEQLAQRSSFDIAQHAQQTLPTYYQVSFFNQRWVQEALGVPVNYTEDANFNNLYFFETGDAVRQTKVHLESLLQNNLQVALVYGDRDARCPWTGVENVSLVVDYPSAHNFRSSGYTPIRTNPSHASGVVRQFGTFSFSRIFDAGHEVSAFQPETLSKIFDRIMFRRDVATGTVRVPQGSRYQTKGPLSSWSIKNKLPPLPPISCYAQNPTATCTQDQLEALANGTAVTHDFFVLSPAP